MLSTIISASVLIVFILLVRSYIRHFPKFLLNILWDVAIIRLLVPWSIPIKFFHAQNGYTSSNSVILSGEMRIMPQRITQLWCIIWIVISSALLMLFCWKYIKEHRKIAVAIPCNNKFVVNFMLEQKLHRKVRVSVSDQFTQPFTCGLFFPIIVLPKNLNWQNEQQISFILEHEMAHVKRFDFGVKVLLTIAICIHWFNPLVWVMAIISNRDIELNCDEHIIRHMNKEQKANYAGTLLHFSLKSQPNELLLSGFSRYAIPERIAAIATPYRNATVTMVVSILLVIVVTTFSFLSFILVPYTPGLSENTGNVKSHFSQNINDNILTSGSGNITAK